jgi:nucleoside 2-deoxyribosyltransferase
MKKLYLSGKISGREIEEAKAHFSQFEKDLTNCGFEVVNPFKVEPRPNLEWHEYMRADIKALCECDGIVMLQGWTDSKGAKLEFHIATELGLQVYVEDKNGIYAD